MVATKDGLEFPETDWCAAGESSCALRWMPSSADGYEAHSEMLLNGQWTTQFRLQ
jgi:hypothetical protein